LAETLRVVQADSPERCFLSFFEFDVPGDGDMSGNNSKNWGPCISCKWWQIEPGAPVENLTVGYCIEEKLQPYQIRITGNGGCNLYMEGKPARGKGSSEKPPTAKPAR
jgi:hypothetical protein